MNELRKLIPSNIVEMTSEWGVSVLGAIAVLLLGFLTAKLFRRWARKALERIDLDQTLIPFLANLVYYLVLAFVVIAVLGLFGVPTTSFVAALGAAGLAVGLALQGTLSNFAAGVMLLFFRPFKVGDYVEAAGEQGNVLEVSVFSTRLETLDHVHVVLPNSAVWGATIKNFTASPVRRNDIAVGISYSDDIGKAREIVRQVLRADERVLTEPAPDVVVTGLGESSVDLLAVPYCKPSDYWDLRFDLTQKIKEGLDRGGISIPFPQRDVHLYRDSQSSGG